MHRFPIKKYQSVKQLIQSEYEHQHFVKFQRSEPVTREELAATHCYNYVEKYLSGNLTELEIRKQGFPWTDASVDRTLRIVGGTVSATRALFSNASLMMSGNIAGGTHHAFYDYGEGFCIFSDIAVACNLALKEFPDQVERILILDLDVHQGNGNAALFQHDPRVFTFSMHCRENYFSAKQQSNIDIELDAGTGDEVYLSKLKTWLPYLFHAVKPQLVFYQAGVDIYEGDRLGKLKVTRAGLQKRNEMIYQAVSRRGIKCVVTMGGGYPKDLEPSSAPFQELTENHADVYRQCIGICSPMIPGIANDAHGC